MRLATNYAPYEEVMKTLGHCLETSLHGKRRRKLRSVRLLYKMTVRLGVECCKCLCEVEQLTFTSLQVGEFVTHGYSWV